MTLEPVSDAKEKLKNLLENEPPGSAVEDVFVVKYMNNRGSAEYTVSTPEIRIHCQNETCNGIRHFKNNSSFQVALGSEQGVVLTYVCRNCANRTKWFALLMNAGTTHNDVAKITKIGEQPPFGPPVPPRVITLIGGDRELFLKGRRAENQSLGIGAFAYYRRVVENQKDRLLGEIIRVADKVGSKPEAIEKLKLAKAEQQFLKAFEMIKDVIPDVLKIQSHNPITLLHRALSEGLHAKSDDDCLEFAHAIRVVLFELAERLEQLLKDNVELTNALSRLLNRDNLNREPPPDGSK